MGFNYAILILPIRVVQAVFALIVLGTLAYTANKTFDSPSEVNFLIFASIWTLLALVYLLLAPAKFPEFAHKFAILGVEAVTMIFWFAGFIALSDLLGDWECGSSFGRQIKICRTSIAGDVFAAFEWVLFAITTGIAALHAWKNKGETTVKQDPVAEAQI
ncbi:membrane-associating domain-containing protein [Leptodontidium sp. 2 PMI_412]|nr:membrane-associating domain-containing protein [Leptodontidium sp. MPI-SDFR-AT-0119]KAH9213329.1 membrane-associating domain-containing protein [Leptodontidium sp. 2 PMI_412]